MLDTHRLRAWPLTPIHIGDGQEITPESFTLASDRLLRFSPFAALARASDPQREQYRKLLKGGDFVGAQRHLAKLAAAGSTGDPGVRVAPACQSDLKAVLEGRSIGKGRVRPFVRCGEAAIIPGSTLKGALRTAWISREAARRDLRGIGPIDIRRTGQAAAELSRRVLDMEGSALEQDPFRDLNPRDAAIPAGRTRFDRAVLAKLARDRPGLAFDQTDGIQMHVERLDCLADGIPVAPFDVQIDLSDAAHTERRAVMASGPKRKVPKTPLNADDLWQAANVFHADLWLYERARFHGGEEPSGRLLDRLLAAFGLTPGADLAEQLTRGGLVLLRLGRYAQFESKAVKIDGKRHGIRAGTKVKPAELVDGGVTRTVVRVAGDIPLPFGWLLMARGGHGPAGDVRADLTELARAATPPPRTAGAPVGAPVTGGQALAGKTRFKRGDRVKHPDYDPAVVVRDVGLNDREMEVDFGDGDGAQPVKVEGWVRR